MATSHAGPSKLASEQQNHPCSWQLSNTYKLRHICVNLKLQVYLNLSCSTAVEVFQAAILQWPSLDEMSCWVHQ